MAVDDEVTEYKGNVKDNQIQEFNIGNFNRNR
jgi:hypothetical protein